MNKLKSLVILLTIIVLTGCVNINKSSYNDIISSACNSSRKIYNTYRKGYKFYLPKGMYVKSNNDYNEIINDDKNTYYLYIDLVSYLNNVKDEYKESKNSYYSQIINNGKNYGILNINEKNSKYLVEIMYNYAKIEVMVDKKDLNRSIANSIIILSSIKYNDGMLKSLSDENVLSYKEKKVNIFNSKSGSEKSNFLKYVEEYDKSDEALPDYDKIK